MLMFERMKEKMRQRQEEREQQIREEKNRLLFKLPILKTGFAP